MGIAEEYTTQAAESRYERVVSYFQHNYRAYLLIAPAGLFLLSVVGYPILQTFQLSFYDAPASASVKTYVGFENYIQIFNSDIFYQLLWQTGRWVVVGVALKTVLGLLIAVHLKGDIRGRKTFRTAFLIPWGIPYAISAVIFRWMLHPQYGYINSILLELGLVEQRLGILGNPDLAWIGVIAADVWIGTPFMAIIFLAGLQSIPDQLYEASAIDGAEKWEQFRYITIPQLKDVIFIATLLSTIWTFVSFDIIWTMTGGGPTNSTATLIIWIYETAFAQGNLGLGAAYSVIGFLFLAVFAVVYLRVYTSGGEEL
jgi:multiple sugar transport system permease protein